MSSPARLAFGAAAVNNGITGDARQYTADLGKRIFDGKVDYVVRQVKRFLGN